VAASAATDCAALLPHASDRGEARLAEIIADGIDDDPTANRKLSVPKPLVTTLAPRIAADAVVRRDWPTARRAFEMARDQATTAEARASAERGLAEATRGLAPTSDARADVADRLAALLEACSGPGDSLDVAVTARLVEGRIQLASTRTDAETCLARRGLLYLQGVDAAVVTARLKR
jgi:hypothetical protein